MILYAIKKLLDAIPTLLILIVLTFFLLRLAPGGPFDTDRVWPPEIQENIERQYGLRDPMPVQFGNFLLNLARGRLVSFQYLDRPVLEIIGGALPASMLLGGLALGFAVLLGIPLGALAAWKRNTWVDSSTMFVAISGVSVPSYLVASVLILLFSLHLGWLPAALWDGPEHIILPALTLGVRPLAVIARLTRASMIEVMSSDYVRTAYSKGVGDFSIIFKHALRNSLIPVLTVLGPLAAYLVTGSFLVESVFEIPGLGKHFVQSIINRDYPLAMVVTILFGVILIAANLAVDLLYGWVDPRIRVDTE
jgi:oligopeptide transport system permease protein